MWSGGADQWGVNHAMTYMSMPHEQVDWASLAQQWIKMKEEAPKLVDKADEGGEAPMEITKDEAAPAVVPRENEWMAPQPGDASATWGAANWNWDQAGAWMQWAGTASQNPDMAAAPGYSTMPNAAPGYSSLPNADAPAIPPVVPPAPMYSYIPATIPPAPAAVDNYTRGYWTGNPPASVNLTTESVKPSRWDTGNSRRKHSSSHNAHQVEALPVPELDAAKRRALPAWIREGLEKMEREKQKKAELERFSKLKKDGGDSYEFPVDEIAEETMTNGDVPVVPKKSRFDSESDDDNGPVEEKPPVTTPRRSRFDQSEPAVQAPPLKPKFKTKEQILQAVMGDVRRILTQLLMEVTSEEIQKAAEETHRQFKKKAPAATLRKTPALASLTGKLGLGIYESDSEDESEPEKVTNEPDSDQELQDRIRRLKKEFTRVEENIEREALELEERERNQLRIGQNHRAIDEPSTTGVEDQVQPSREGTTADDHQKNHHETIANKDVHENKDRPDQETEDSRSSGSAVQSGERRTSKDKRSKPKDRVSESRSKKKKRKSSSEESSKSESESSSSSSSSDDDDDDNRSKKSKHRHHHKHRGKKSTRRNRYSLSASPQQRKERSPSRDTRSRSRSRDRYSRHRSHRERSRDSRSRASHTHNRRRKYTPEKELRKRQRSSSGSSDSGRKYRKSSHRRR